MSIAQLLTHDRLTRTDVEAIARAARVQRELPAPSVDDDGEHWLPSAVRDWARDAGVLLPSQ